MTWLSVDIVGVNVNLAQITLLAMFFFYLTLDWILAVVFLLMAGALEVLATRLGDRSLDSENGWPGADQSAKPASDATSRQEC